PEVLACTEARLRHGAAATETYLRPETILSAARQSGADGIHPGYGFLSENPVFARAVSGAGITFIGPPAEVIASLGDKVQAKAIAAAAGVPLLPGWTDDAGDVKALRRGAADVGYPLLVKAVAGGGGKGMRRVDDRDG